MQDKLALQFCMICVAEASDKNTRATHLVLYKLNEMCSNV